MRFVRYEDDCWLWTGAIDKGGYGRFVLNSKRTSALAHRVGYELMRGPIPDGLELDHLCRNHACVNPDHLEAVTHRENILRGDYRAGYQAVAALQRAKTHCPQGHPYSGSNLYILPKSGGRVCRICAKASQQRFYERKRAG
jgi:hypothetical protein